MKTIKRTFRMVSVVAFSALWLVPGCLARESGDESEADDLGWADATEGEAVTLEGTVVVMSTMYKDHDPTGAEDHEDGEAHPCELEYYLQRGPRDRAPLRLQFDGATPSVQTGDEISVVGRWQTRDERPSIAVDEVLSTGQPAGVPEEDELGQSSQAIVSVRPPKKHKIAVLLLGNTAVTAAQAKAMIDAYSPGSASAFIGENSGLVDTFDGKVFSYPDLQITGCDQSAIKVDALDKFEAEGNNIDDYTNVAYVFDGVGCKYFASGSVHHPGSSVRADTWYDNSFDNCTTVAHELGHNLGFNHSNSTACGDKVYKASRNGCMDTEYGNKQDVMSTAGSKQCSSRGHYSVMHKRYAGYLSQCEDVTAGGSAVFRLSAAEGSCGMRSLRIPIAGESNYYYLEFRKPGAGEFSGVAGESRVLLNVSNDPPASDDPNKAAPTPWLLDATPEMDATPEQAAIVTNPWLVVGTTYNLPGSVSIKVLSIGDIAKIEVTMPAGAGAKCRGGATPPGSAGEVGGLCGAIADKTYQAENKTYQKNCTTSTSQPGYTGTGYMDFGGAGSVVELGNVEVPRYGKYKLTFRYANGTATNKTSKIAVNGQAAGQLNFPGTGGWSTWKTTNPLEVTLKKGINKIRVTSVAEGPNLDKVLIEASP